MFKDNLKRLREEAKYTQEELARKLFVSRSAVAKWEQGRGIPKEETIEDIAKIFNVPISSFYGENEPQKVIEKIEKKSRLNLLITIVVSILIIVLSIVIYNNKYKYKIEYDKFFSEKTLKEFGLEYLRPITLNLKGSININDSYRVDIDSYAVFEEYVNYLFNYFKDNPNIAYYGFEVTKPIEGSTLLDFKTYILKSDNLEDYKTSIHLDYNNQKQIDYTFYYLTNIPKKRNVGDAIDFNYIKISYQHEIGSWIKVKDIEYKLNTNLIIRSTKGDTLIDYYLFDEYFDVETIKISQNNFDDYFVVHCNTSNPGYAWYTFRYKDQHYFRSYVPLTFEVGEDEKLESKKTIIYSPIDGNYLKMKNAYFGFDPNTNEISLKYKIDVEDGYIYRAYKK